MMNLSIAGNVGQEPETRSAGQNTVTNFSVAVNYYDRLAKEKATQWVRVAVWGKRGEQLAGLLSKGDKVACSGSMQLREYEGKNGKGISLELTVNDVTLCGRGGESVGSQGPRSGGERSPVAKPAVNMGEFDDDQIPF